MAKSHNGKPTAVARARVVETPEHKPIVEILLATAVALEDEKRMHVLVSKMLKEVGKVESETMAMDPLDVDFAYRKLNVAEVQHHSKD